MAQSKYICDLLHKTHMVETHSISSPMVSNCKLSRHGADLFHDPTLYRCVIGALHYASLTRPEIDFAVNKVCQFMVTPLDFHLVVVKKNLMVSQGHFVSWPTPSAYFYYKALGSSCVLWCWLGIRCGW